METFLSLKATIKICWPNIILNLHPANLQFILTLDISFMFSFFLFHLLCTNTWPKYTYSLLLNYPVKFGYANKFIVLYCTWQYVFQYALSVWLQIWRYCELAYALSISIGHVLIRPLPWFLKSQKSWGGGGRTESELEIWVVDRSTVERCRLF